MKIMQLGGSSQQIPALLCAHGLGYTTILCDYLKDNPGQEFCDIFYEVSTTDMDAVLEVAMKEKIDGILAYASDPAAPTAAYVAEKLGLPTNPYKSVKLLSTKDAYRRFLKSNGFYTPRFESYDHLNQAISGLRNFKLPILLKPVDSSGSKGIFKIETVMDLESHWSESIRYSRVQRCILEEFVDQKDYQVAGDGISVDGRLIFSCFGNDHFDSENIYPFVPVAASFPSILPKRIQVKIRSEIQRVFTLLELRNGTYNFDIRITPSEDVFLMEIGPRSGGNYIPQVIRYLTGVDSVLFAVQSAVGNISNWDFNYQQNGFYGYFALHVRQSGILKGIHIDNDIKLKHILEMHLIKSIGEHVDVFSGANKSIGILIMRFDSQKQMLDMCDHPEKWLEIKVE